MKCYIFYIIHSDCLSHCCIPFPDYVMHLMDRFSRMLLRTYWDQLFIPGPVIVCPRVPGKFEFQISKV